MNDRLTFPLEQQSSRVLVALFPFSVHCSVGSPLSSLFYLASFVAISYWKHAFSQMSLVISVVDVSISVASVVVVVS